MTPFEEYLAKSKEIRATYAARIAQNSAQKQQLEEEMKSILAELLNTAEAKEIAYYKHI